MARSVINWWGKVTKRIDLMGKVFGRWTVSSLDGKDKHGKLLWRCMCECGKEAAVLGECLRRGTTRSCGCLSVEKKTSHGQSRTRLYRIWHGMRQRCDNTSRANYKHYGGRGITYDPRWGAFEKFLEDMGDGYSDHLTLDRIDNDKGYSKENCRWTTYSVQISNRGKRPGCKTKYIGVYGTRYHTFFAEHSMNGKKQYLGIYKTAIEAATAYDNAVEPLIGNRPNGTTIFVVPPT